MPQHSSGDLIADRRYEYARAYAAEGDQSAAADLHAQALERVPAFLPARIGLADALMALGRRDEAVPLLIAIAADDPADLFGAALKLAALGERPMPSAPSAAYVRGLFDDYADRFDTALVDGLGYRVPGLIGTAVATARPGGEPFQRALDLGCGTGLAGAVLRERVAWLEGVDLSPDMVARAKTKGLYDRLAVGDVVDALVAAEAGYDLIVAADVLVYVGALEAVFAAVANRLTAGGLFAFSVEAAETGDLTLRDSLRYAHGEAYLRRLAQVNGLRMVSLDRETLRFDRGSPVTGFIAVLTGQADADKAFIPVSFPSILGS